MGLEVDSPRRTVCVTGASGFVASWLVKRLLEKGYFVRATVRNPDNEAKTSYLRKLPGAAERLELVRANLVEDGSFDAAVQGCEGVFHTASPVVTIHSDPQTEMIEPAVKGTLNVLKSCIRTDTVKRIVMTSSSSTLRFNNEYKSHIPIDESSWSSENFCRQYRIWYGLAKTLAEKVAWEFAKKHGLDLVVILPSYVIGPVLPLELSYTATDTLALLKGETSKFALFGRMGYVHLDDVATAHILVYENPLAEGRYICSSTELENHELGKFLANRYPFLNIPTEFPKSSQVRRYDFDCTKIHKLGLRFKDLGEMFDDAVANFLERGLLLATGST